MSERSELHDAIERAIKEHCAGGDLWLCAHIASEPFDARIAELEREIERLDAQWREELRIYRETGDARIAELDGLLADAGEVVADAARYLAIDPRGQETELARLNALSAAIDAARANGGEG